MNGSNNHEEQVTQIHEARGDISVRNTILIPAIVMINKFQNERSVKAINAYIRMKTTNVEMFWERLDYETSAVTNK